MTSIDGIQKRSIEHLSLCELLKVGVAPQTINSSFLYFRF